MRRSRIEVSQEFEFNETVGEGMATSTLAPSSLGSEDYSYDGYVPSTIDPDWTFTILIIIGCLLVNLSLPLWLYLGKRFGFHETPESRRRRKGGEWETSYNKTGGGGNNNNLSGDDILLKQLDDARSVISGYSYAPGGSVAGESAYAPSPASVMSGSVAMSRAGTHLSFNHNNLNGGGDAASVFSTTSGFTEAILAARPKRMPHARRHARTKRIVVSKSCVNGDDGDSISTHTRDNGVKTKLDVRMAAEFKKAEMDLLHHRNLASPYEISRNYGERITPNTTTSDVGSGIAFDDSRSQAPSILSKLDADAISVRDAVDARDGVHMPLEYDGKSGKNSHGDSYASAAWSRLMEVVDFDKEMKKYLALAAHYSAQGFVEEILGIVEIAAIGNYMGLRQVQAYIVVETVTGFTGSITTGFYECAGVLIPQANGARNDLLVGRYMQLAILFYTFTALPGAVFWSFFTDSAVTWYKFDEETARMAQLYVYATLPGYLTYGIDAVFYEFLNTVGYERYTTWFTFIGSCMHTGIVVGMLYGGVTDLYILGLFETCSDIFLLAVNFTILVRRGWLDPYWEGLWYTNGLLDLRAVKNVVNTAIPLSFAWILTYGEWEIMTLFCRHMGDTGAEVAAWGLMGYLWNAFETITDGFGDAAEVRVGFRMGSGQVRLAKLATDKALFVSLTSAIYATGLLFVLASYIPKWLTPEPTLQRMIFDIIPLIGFGQILMVWGMVAWAILGAQGRIRTATVLEFFVSWGVGAPIAAILVFVFNYNIEGIVGGLSIGYTVGTNIYLYLLYTSDWEALSANVVSRSAMEGQTYNEFDWDDLPDEIQDAAADLGYNKWIWESESLQPESDGKDWHQLTSAERKAALNLGYNKKLWNGDVDSEDATGGDKMGSKGANDSSSTASEDWVNLSKEAKMAANILGYNQSIWDNDGSPPTEDKDWDELSPKERAAAKTLGYTQEKWNGEDDDESDDDETDDISYHTPKTTDSAHSRDESTGSKGSSIIDNILASCSFDSRNEGTETDPSVSNITKITSLLGFSQTEESKKRSTR